MWLPDVFNNRKVHCMKQVIIIIAEERITIAHTHTHTHTKIYIYIYIVYTHACHHTALYGVYI